VLVVWKGQVMQPKIDCDNIPSCWGRTKPTRDAVVTPVGVAVVAWRVHDLVLWLERLGCAGCISKGK
jgi:hypothetical protein